MRPRQRLAETVAVRLGQRLLDRVVRGPVRAVDALEAALPAREVGLVLQEEEAQRADVLVALRRRDHIGVVERLGRLVDHRRRLDTRVQRREAWDTPGLPA